MPIGVFVVVQFVCVVVVVVVVLLLLLLVVVAALLVGYFAVTNVTFSVLYVGSFSFNKIFGNYKKNVLLSMDNFLCQSQWVISGR